MSALKDKDRARLNSYISDSESGQRAYDPDEPLIGSDRRLLDEYMSRNGITRRSDADRLELYWREQERRDAEDYQAAMSYLGSSRGGRIVAENDIYGSGRAQDHRQSMDERLRQMEEERIRREQEREAAAQARQETLARYARQAAQRVAQEQHRKNLPAYSTDAYEREALPARSTDSYSRNDLSGIYNSGRAQQHRDDMLRQRLERAGSMAGQQGYDPAYSANQKRMEDVTDDFDRRHRNLAQTAQEAEEAYLAAAANPDFNPNTAENRYLRQRAQMTRDAEERGMNALNESENKQAAAYDARNEKYYSMLPRRGDFEVYSAGWQDANPNYGFTEEQAKVYTYLNNRYGDLAAKRYGQYIIRGQNAAEMQDYQSGIARDAATPVGATLGLPVSVAATAISGTLGYADYLIQMAKRRTSGNYVPIDYNTGAQAAGVMRDTIRQGAGEYLNRAGTFREDIPVVGGKGLGDLYRIFGSVADSYAIAMTAGEGGAALLGLSAAQEGIRQAHERGLSDSQAVALGTLQGINEAAFEYISLDKLVNMPDAETAGVIRNILVQAGIEASEEGATTIANTIADAWVSGDKSEINGMVRELMAQGYDRRSAEKAAWLYWSNNLAYDMLAGAISGAASSTLSMGVDALGKRMEQNDNLTELGAAVRTRPGANNGEPVSQLVEIGMSAPQGTELYNLARNIAAEIEAGGVGSVSDADVGRLYASVSLNRMSWFELHPDVSGANNLLSETAGEDGNPNAAPPVDPSAEDAPTEAETQIVRQATEEPVSQEPEVQEGIRLLEAAHGSVGGYDDFLNTVSAQQNTPYDGGFDAAGFVQQRTDDMASIFAQREAEYQRQQAAEEAQNAAEVRQIAAQMAQETAPQEQPVSAQTTQVSDEPQEERPAQNPVNVSSSLGLTKEIRRSILNGERTFKVSHNGNVYVSDSSVAVRVDGGDDVQNGVRELDASATENIKKVFSFAENEGTPVSGFIDLKKDNPFTSGPVSVLEYNGGYAFVQPKYRRQLYKAGNVYVIPDWRNGYPIIAARDNQGLAAFALPLSIRNTANVQAAAREIFGGGTQAEEQPEAPVRQKEPKGTSPAEVKGGNRTPSERISDELLPMIKDGTKISPAKLFSIADEAFSGTQAEGAYTPKDAYDAMELAVNRHLLTAAAKYNTDSVQRTQAAVAELQKMLNNLPTQTKRTQEQEQFQQFSTPPTIAYLAAWSANITPQDSVLEPSAGIGGIAVFPKAWGASVTVNELSERRLAVLEKMGFDAIYNENAEQIDNILPASVQPTVVLMNPPFSATAGRTSTNKTANAKRHIEQALSRLSDGGRLVAVLGRGMADDSKTFSGWWNDLRKDYTIRANIGIDGKNYTKYGTSFDVQVVVIDKTGPQGDQKTFTATYTNLMDIPKDMEGVRNARSKTTVSAGTESGRLSADERGSSVGVGRAGTGSVPVSDGGNGSGAVSQRSEDIGTRTAQEGRGGDRGGNAVGNRSDAGSDRGSRNGQRVGSGNGRIQRPSVPNAGSGVSQRNGRSGGGLRVTEGSLLSDSENVKSLPKKRTRTAAQPKAQDEGAFARYTVQALPFDGAVEHPANLVESQAMGTVNMPKLTYVPNLPASLVTSGTLSDAQLVQIGYAGQANSQRLPDGTRKGYLIGDGTGVGKGRTLAGIIADNMRSGRKKAVWVSKNKDLFPDAVRDWTALGGSASDFINNKKGEVPAKKQITAESGIFFTTYNTNATAGRMDQLVEWLGKDFDGVIVFDEAHEMGHAVDVKGTRGTNKAAEKAKKAVELQGKLPNARIVYASATAASDVTNLSYAERLGLWGQGTPFASVHEFISQIGASGLAAMELVSRDMKAMGSYLARSISYQGVEYSNIEHRLTPVQRQIYDTMSEAWQVTLKDVESALSVTNGKLNGDAKAAALSAYYSSLQRFYNQVLTSMAMPSVLKSIQSDLDEGRSVVIQITNTNEAQMERKLKGLKENDEDLEALDMTPRETLIDYLMNAFPVNAYEEYEDDKGNKGSRLVTDSEGKPVIDKKAVAMRDALVDRVMQMSIPDGPLEMLFDTFGPEMVAENTGRKQRVVTIRDENGERRRVLQSVTNNTRAADVEAFQNGDKRILVFSDKGGTGKSYHADRSAKNQQQRAHYVLQPGWQSEKAVQGFGRTHRSNEANQPIYRLVTTDIRGHKRFVSTIARRLNQLGALTQGQRDAGNGIFDAKDNLETPLASTALRGFYERLIGGKIPDLDARDVLGQLGLLEKFTNQFGALNADVPVAGEMKTFLNRILAMKVDTQNRVFDAFQDVYDEYYDKAVQEGQVDLGMENVRADSIEVVDDTVIRTDETTGAQTRYVQAKVKRKNDILTNVSDLNMIRSGFEGLYRLDDGSIRAVYRMPEKTDAYTGEIVRKYRMQSAAAQQFGTWNEDTLKKRAEAVPRKQWASAWKEAVSNAPKYREETYHLLTGTLLPVWNMIKSDTNAKVVRLVADNGTQYLGRRIPASQIDSTLAQFHAKARTKETYTGKGLMTRILGGEEAHLTENRWVLKRSRVAGENRIEITGQNLWAATNYNGVFSEKINYSYRYFIPTDPERGAAIIAAIIKDNPVVDVARTRSDADEVHTGRQTVDAAETGGITGFRERTTRVDSGRNTKVLAPEELIARLSHDFGVHITEGHVRGRGVGGFYDPQTGGTRTRRANMVPEASHEVGHALDNRYGYLSDNAPQNIQEQLRTIAGAQGEHGNPLHEGMAEFFRKYMKNSVATSAAYPELTDYVLDHMSRRDTETLETMADLINNYYAQGATDYEGHLFSESKAGPDVRTVWDKAGDNLNRAWQKTVDSLHGLRIFSDKLGGNAYKYARISNYSSVVAANTLSKAIYHPYTHERIGESMLDALSGVNMRNKEEYGAFCDYLISKRSITLIERGILPFGNIEDDPRNTVGFHEERLRELDRKYPQFAETSERLYAFNRNVMKAYGVDTGLVSARAFNSMVEKEPCYVPFQRVAKGKGAGTGAGTANRRSGVRRIRGSTRSVFDPIGAMYEQTAKIIDAGLHNKTMTELCDVCERDASGMSADFAEKVPAPMQRQIDRLREEKLRVARLATGMIEEGELTEEEGEGVLWTLRNIDDFVTEWHQARQSSDDTVVTVMRNGQREFWKINDPMLLESLTDSNISGRSTFISAMAKANNFTRQLITGANAVWALTSNAPKDILNASFNEGIPITKIIVGSAWAYVNKIKAEGGKFAEADEIIQRYYAMGGGEGYINTREIERNARQQMKKDFGLESWLTKLNPFEWLEFIGNTMEFGTRAAVFRHFIKQGYTDEDAFFESLRATTDFRRHGSSKAVQSMNAAALFFNSSLQGATNNIETLLALDVPKSRRNKVRRTRFAKYLLTSAVAALLMMLPWRDREDEYKRLSNYTKQHFFLIPRGILSREKEQGFIALPKPNTISILDNLMEATAARFVFGDERAFEGFGEYVEEELLPPFVDHAVKGVSLMAQGKLTEGVWTLADAAGDLGVVGYIYQWAVNRNYLGNPIVSKSYEYLPAEQQYNDKTSRLAVALGQALHTSPMYLDHFFGGVFGFAWSWQKALLPSNTEMRDASLGLKNKFLKDSLYSTDIIDRMYDRREEADKDRRRDDGDMDAAMWYTTLDRQAAFYSRFNRLCRGSDRTVILSTRAAVLDSIEDVNRCYDTGEFPEESRAVFDAVAKLGDSSLLPAYMQTDFKVDGKEYTITSPTTYYQFQTMYNDLYFRYVGDEIRDGRYEASDIKHARENAADQAKAAIIRIMGN